MKAVTVAIATLLTISAAQTAAAQMFVNPFVGSSISSPTGGGRSTKPGIGIAFGTLGKIVGFETEVAYQPEVIDTTDLELGKSRVFTFAANTLIGPTLGAVKPYGAIGFGNLNLNVKSLASLVIPDPTSISNNYFTFNAGGGVVGFPAAHVGVRADLRYFRAYGFNTADLEVSGLSLDRFDFWRANIGLALKF